MADGPHTLASKVRSHAHAASFQYGAATVRLNANLELVGELALSRGEDYLQMRWNQWSSILQREGARFPERKVWKNENW